MSSKVPRAAGTRKRRGDQQKEPVAGPSTSQDVAFQGPSSSSCRATRISFRNIAALAIGGPSRNSNRGRRNGRASRFPGMGIQLTPEQDREINENVARLVAKTLKMEREFGLKSQFLARKPGLAALRKRRRTSRRLARGTAPGALWETFLAVRGSVDEEIPPSPEDGLVDEDEQASRVVKTIIGTPNKKSRVVRKNFFLRWALLNRMVEGSCVWNNLPVSEMVKDKMLRLMGIMTWSLDAMRADIGCGTYARNKNGRISSTFTLDSLRMDAALKQAVTLHTYWKISQEAKLMEPLYLILTIFSRPDGLETDRDANQLVDLRISLEKASHELKR